MLTNALVSQLLVGTDTCVSRRSRGQLDHVDRYAEAPANALLPHHEIEARMKT